MSNEKKQLVPELRFAEFEGEWKNEPLKDIYSFKITNSFSRDKLNYEEGKVKNIHYGDIHTKFSTLFDITKETVPFINKDVELKRINKENYCQEGDIVIADASEDIYDIGKSIEIVNLNKEKLLAGLHTFLARQIDYKLVPGFGGYLFKSDSIVGQIRREAQGAKVLGISKNRVSEINVYYPKCKKEQQKIANCLSSLDEVISAETEKLDVLKEHKKGLLQKLFPKEGQTQPEYRFPEFKNDGDWEVRDLDSLCKFVRGPFGGALKKEIFVKDGYAVYEQAQAIYNQFENFRYFITVEKYEELKRFAVKASDIIMSCSGTMGKFSIIPVKFKKGVINQALLKLTVKENLYINFIKVSLELPTNQNKLLAQSAGGAIKNVVGVSELKKIKVLIPSILEQQKIANCLSSLDKLIEDQTQKIEGLQNHKKGLLQKLFPNINDVTV